MNQGIYRLVFNKARGLLMVAGELARGSVKRCRMVAPRRFGGLFIWERRPFSWRELLLWRGFDLQPGRWRRARRVE